MDSLFAEHFSLDDWLPLMDVNEIEPIDPLRVVTYDSGDEHCFHKHVDLLQEYSGIANEDCLSGSRSSSEKVSQCAQQRTDTDCVSRITCEFGNDACSGTCGETKSTGFRAYFERKFPSVSLASCEIGNESVAMHDLQNAKRFSYRKDSSNEKIKLPSKFCHVCLRKAENVEQVPCSQFETSKCRKVVCRRCFDQFGWDWTSASTENSTWMCPHCRNQCPERATCNIYHRTNQREQKKKRKRRDSTKKTEKISKPASTGNVSRPLLPKTNDILADVQQ
mmetsp:Transcript_10433/g.18805  ORF Transcript_10433/g.18805 Transcript_10433/m.18805 type:complete len:278 (-) Transcript_10433:359-1192(-)|eukprot:CAMPEP_0182445068 /NCGR_PEP_ID=MMETSP1172-20130603/3316_1 /TAXON_ID=708627 /ORGANISM="Timspurckia oligopyrenoides, Strain CCMP3278" /LENGTH=277 /DNA_ID=CAMNT_0024640767 /DNA_START=1771 /DNA_END=2604 /DNA_ORIENTATION=-